MCLCEWLQVCNCATRTQFPWRPEEGIGSLGTQVPHVCELPGGCWDLVHGTISPAPLQIGKAIIIRAQARCGAMRLRVVEAVG